MFDDYLKCVLGTAGMVGLRHDSHCMNTEDKSVLPAVPCQQSLTLTAMRARTMAESSDAPLCKMQMLWHPSEHICMGIDK